MTPTPHGKGASQLATPNQLHDFNDGWLTQTPTYPAIAYLGSLSAQLLEQDEIELGRESSSRSSMNFAGSGRVLDPKCSK